MPQRFLSAADRQRLNSFPGDIAVSDIGQVIQSQKGEFAHVNLDLVRDR